MFHNQIQYILILFLFITACEKHEFDFLPQIENIKLIKNSDDNLLFNLEGILQNDTIYFVLPSTSKIYSSFSLDLKCENCSGIFLNENQYVTNMRIDSSVQNNLILYNGQEKKSYAINFLRFSNSLKIIFLGNSLTITNPNSELEWYGNWGMAASSRDKDYVHLTLSKLYNFTDSIEFSLYSISSFERKFWNYIIPQNLAQLKFKPNLVVLNIGENIDDNIVQKKMLYKELDEFIKSVVDTKYTKVIIVNSFWKKARTNSILRKLSVDNNYFFVDISNLENNLENMAFEYFLDKGVGSHPSDSGMLKIHYALFPKILLAGS